MADVRPNAGRSGARWRKLRADLRARQLPCWLCGQPIDYTLRYDHPQAFTVDHAVPRSQRIDLAEDPANLRPAHAQCNRARGVAAPRRSLGQRSVAW